MSETKSQALFFLSCPLNMEQACINELQEKFVLFTKAAWSSEIIRQEGGFYFHGDLSWVVDIQKYLKLPNRIQWVLLKTRCRDLPKLYAKVSKIHWNKYLDMGLYQCKISAKKSRLNHEKRIEESFRSAIAKYLQGNTPPKVENPYTHSIYLRLFDDEMQISLDLSGDHLHKRGYRLQHIAPLRENLSALAFYLVEKKDQISSIIDPMVGCGTNLTEALLYYQANTFRTYAGDFLKDLKSKVSEPLLALKPSNIKEIYGYDIDTQCVDFTKKNIATIPYEVKAELKEQDFFELELEREFDLFISNPPYGERIKLSKHFWKNYLEKLSKLKWKEALVFIPRDQSGLFKNTTSWGVVSEHLISNGGIPISLLYLKK